MSDTAISDELVAAYRATEYRVTSSTDPVVLRIDRQSEDLINLFARAGKTGATFITAENPFSESLTESENAANQARLYQDLTASGATIFEGYGQGEDPAWPAEASYLAIGISREQACELGCKYQQNAIIWIDADGVPELLLLR